MDITDFNSQLQKLYKDLVRLEPVRRAIGGKTLDMMFIINEVKNLCSLFVHQSTKLEVSIVQKFNYKKVIMMKSLKT